MAVTRRQQILRLRRRRARGDFGGGGGGRRAPFGRVRCRGGGGVRDRVGGSDSAANSKSPIFARFCERRPPFYNFLNDGLLFN